MVNNKKKKQQRKGGKAAKGAKGGKGTKARKATNPLLLNEKKVVRVSFEGLVSMITQTDNTIIEYAEECKRRKDGVPTFCETGLGATRIKLAGLWPGGSRDLSSVTPSRIYYPHRLASAYGRLNLISSDTSREWYKGSVQHAAMNDKIPYIKALGVSPRYREARDATFCANIREHTMANGAVPGINYTGDVYEMMTRCKQMQNSFWALFYSRLWHTVNTLGMSSVDAYPVQLGFVWNTNSAGELAPGEVAVGSMEIPRRLMEARRLILATAQNLAHVVRSVVEHTPCNLQPWQGMNTHYSEVHQMNRPIEQLDSFVRSCQLEKFLPNTAEFVRTRVIWGKTIAAAATLRSLFMSSMAATAILQSMLIESNILNPETIPVEQLRARYTGNRELYGYTIAHNEYKRILEEGCGSPAVAFMPFDNDAFTFGIKNTTDSGYMSQHPLIFWTSIQFAEMQVPIKADSIPEALEQIGYSAKAHSIASKTLLMNAFGPDKTTMRTCFDQGIAENRRYAVIDTSKKRTRLDPSSPSMISLRFAWFIDDRTFNLSDFTQLFVRLLHKNSVTDYLTSTITMNPKWLIKSKYLKNGINTAEHKMLRKVVAIQILSEFVGGWKYSRTCHRDMNATLLQSVARRWLARKRVVRLKIAIAEEEAEKQRIGEMHRQAKRKHEHTMRYLVWSQRRVAANFATKCRAATDIAKVTRAWLGRKTMIRKKRAVVVLQCWSRGRLRYNRFNAIAQATIIFQRLVRGFIGRTRYKHMRAFVEKLRLAQEASEEINRRTRAAKTLQRYCRGHQGRTRVANELAVRAEHFRVLHFEKVMKVAEQLSHFFYWDNLISDCFMMQNRLPDGVIPFGLLMGFPSIAMYLCTIPPKYHVLTLVEASRHVPGVVATIDGILHLGFTQQHQMVPVVEMVPVVKMVPLQY